MDFLSIVNDSIYRIVTPYQDINTTIYIIRTQDGVMVFDTGSSDADVENYILPALDNLKISLGDVKSIFISHKHRDHANGLRRLLKEIPEAVIYSRSDALKEEYAEYDVRYFNDGETVMTDLVTVTIPGHTLDSSAIFDTRTKTMITGDCLQLFGIFGSGDWASNVSFIPQHFEALDKLEKMDIKEIYTAHNYHPIGYKFIGKYQIKEALDACKKPLLDIGELIKNNPQLDDEEIRSLRNSDKTLPTINLTVVKAVRSAIAEGII